MIILLRKIFWKFCRQETLKALRVEEARLCPQLVRFKEVIMRLSFFRIKESTLRLLYINKYIKHTIKLRQYQL